MTIFNFIKEPELIAAIEKVATPKSFKAGETIVPLERYIRVIPLVISGTIKVIREDEQGHEFFLYHIIKGESCAVSLSTCINQKISSIKAIAEDDTELLAIPAKYAIDWFNVYPSWRNFVLQSMDQRFDNLIETIDTLAFSKTDDRLLAYLKSKSKALNTTLLHITHQEIANELSTTREMISRLLKNMEKRNVLKLHRNNIEIF